MSWRPGHRSSAGGQQPQPPRDVLGGSALTLALSGLLALAVGMGYVSYTAQRAYVVEHKASALAATVEALGLDAGAVIFACLAFAAALAGRAAARARVGNLACVGGSLTMNLMSAQMGNIASMAVWAMPAALYAFASDTLIGEVRARALAAREQADSGSAFVSLGRALVGLGLFGLRLVFDARSTVGGFRSWVLASAPVAPGWARRELHAGGQRHASARGRGVPASPGEAVQAEAVPAPTALTATGPGRPAPGSVAELDGTLRQRFDALVDALVDSGQLSQRVDALGQFADAVGLTRKSAARYLDQALTRHATPGRVAGVA